MEHPKTTGLCRFACPPVYWLGVVGISLAMMAVALYYQHVKQELPCLLCIHVRLILLGLILVGGTALLIKPLRLPANLLATGLGGFFVYTSYQLLGTERGWIEGACQFTLGFPSWLAIDQWLPAVFGVEMPCGYTPELLFGITMAEGLLVISIMLTALAAMMTVCGLRR